MATGAPDPLARVRIQVEGVVQGVGFRPFVHALAGQLALSGFVGNDVTGVFIEVEGPAARVDDFVAGLRRDAPALATIERIRTERRAPSGAAGFTIMASEVAGARSTFVSADTATCAECLAELNDPGNRRCRYPFINCTNCGPRFTIVRQVPYDRPFTTMSTFAMCPACQAEYDDPRDRRFHAQPTCCPACGPALRFGWAGAGRGEPDRDAVASAATALHQGGVLAVKGLGGYHLAALAGHGAATTALRARKHREDKPFAVMVADLDQAVQLCHTDPAAEALLASRARPIVLMDRRCAAAVAPAVAPGNRQLGIMLPYTPVHHLLLREVGAPIVLTSGNVSDEPIAYTDEDAMQRLAGIADAYLTHDRAIHVRTDDSVVRVFRAQAMPLRRSRGYAPEPVRLSRPVPRQVLACGAQLKATFCFAKGRHAFVSHHIGDLENYETLRSYADGIEHYARLFDVVPAVVAHDLHPEYLSTTYAMEMAGVDVVGVQHHHAHISSCLADNDHDGPVIGVAFDGTGYGPDGTLWGGEFLVADLAGYVRGAHLAGVPLPGGAAAIRQPWRMAVAYLDAAFDASPPQELAVLRRNPSWPQVAALGRRGVNAPLTTSAGRLFDAVAALLGVRDAVTYEGQAAIELEQLADPDERGSYPVRAAGDGVLALAGTDLIRAVVDDLAGGAAAATIAARVHNGLADAVVRTCEVLRTQTGLSTVALSGGVFQNMLLLGGVVDGLTELGFAVLTHRRVPCNDGGISLGQAVVAAELDRRAGL